jgi:hypothetical protein
MPTSPTSKISVSEWRTALAAGRHYREYLAATAPGIQDEDQQLVAFDDIERIDRIIRSLDYQMGEEQHKQGASPAG